MDTLQTLYIHGIDQEGRGVARDAAGKTVFVHNALPQETVRAQVLEQKSHFAIATAQEIVSPASQRIAPACPYYDRCGGCSLQHAEFGAQVAYKQRVFEEQLRRIGKVQPENILPPLYGVPWHYRHRTRLSVHVRPDNTLIMGYLGKQSRRVVAVDECPVLVQPLSGSLKTIRAVLQRVHQQLARAGIRAIELSAGSHGIAALNIISRKRLPESVLQTALSHLNQGETVWQIWQQTDEHPPQLVAPRHAPPLSFRLPEFGLTLPYRMGDFTQVNPLLNPIMVMRAVQLLAPQPNERIADLFCGLGNFSLPLAKSGAQIVGMEGVESLTQRAADNARANGLPNTQFFTADLFHTTGQTVKQWGYFDKMLLDPPRAGAQAVVQALHPPFLPQKIVYVSCNPATFARDAAILADKGYRFCHAGVMNLFPQTAHVEAMGVFELR